MASTAKANKQERAKLSTIFPSHENDEIYGAIDPKDIELINLANDIAKNGIRDSRKISPVLSIWKCTISCVAIRKSKRSS